MNVCSAVDSLWGSMVLIDTWWNVNSDKLPSWLTLDTVLIDTWWNVNEEKLSDTILVYRVLIDTWWNVN